MFGQDTPQPLELGKSLSSTGVAGADVAARARGERNPCVLAERGTQLAAERARQVRGDVEIAGAEHRRVARKAAEDCDRRRRLSRVCLDQAQQIERQVLTCLGVIAVGGHPMDLATGPARSDWPKSGHRPQRSTCGAGDDRLSDSGVRRVLAQWSADVWPGVGVSGGQPDRCPGSLGLDADADSVTAPRLRRCWRGMNGESGNWKFRI